MFAKAVVVIRLKRAPNLRTDTFRIEGAASVISTAWQLRALCQDDLPLPVMVIRQVDYAPETVRGQASPRGGLKTNA